VWFFLLVAKAMYLGGVYDTWAPGGDVRLLQLNIKPIFLVMYSVLHLVEMVGCICK
jgi:hypothetical protein